MSKAVLDRTHRVDVHIGHHIRLVRQMRRMTQSQLAAHIDLTFQQVQKYERGSNRVSASTLVLIAEALAVPVSDFFNGLRSYDVVGATKKATLSAEGWEVAAIVTSMTRGGFRRRLLSVAREMAAADSELNNVPAPPRDAMALD